MNTDELLKRWAADKLDMDPAAITTVYFEHEEGYCNDSGTDWPATTTAVVRSPLGTRYISCDTDVTDLITDVLESAVRQCPAGP